MLWKLLLLAACAMVVWMLTRPAHPAGDAAQAKARTKESDLAYCPKCGVYHHPDAPCQKSDAKTKTESESP